MANINIYGELYNDTPNGYVAPATQIKDVDLGKTQNQINAELTASGSASEANTGYVTCGTAAATAAKEINDTTTLAGFVLDSNIRLLVKMTYANTAENPTLNINGTGAKVINYNGAVASAENSWNANEILDVFYDGTSYVARPYRNIDAEPTAGSENLVKSGGTERSIQKVNLIIPKSLSDEEKLIARFNIDALKTSSTEYLTIDGNYFTEDTIDSELFVDNSVNILNSYNVFDKAHFKSGYRLDDNGNEVADAVEGYLTTLIPAKGGLKFISNFGFARFYYYDVNKNFIRRTDGGGVADSPNQFPPENGLCYISIQVKMSVVNSVGLDNMILSIKPYNSSTVAALPSEYVPFSSVKGGLIQVQNTLWKDDFSEFTIYKNLTINDVVKKSEIVDNLESSDSNKVLSAKQGKALDEKINTEKGERETELQSQNLLILQEFTETQKSTARFNIDAFKTKYDLVSKIGVYYTEEISIHSFVSNSVNQISKFNVFDKSSRVAGKIINDSGQIVNDYSSCYFSFPIPAKGGIKLLSNCAFQNTYLFKPNGDFIHRDGGMSANVERSFRATPYDQELGFMMLQIGDSVLESFGIDNIMVMACPYDDTMGDFPSEVVPFNLQNGGNVNSNSILWKDDFSQFDISIEQQYVPVTTQITNTALFTDITPWEPASADSGYSSPSTGWGGVTRREDWTATDKYMYYEFLEHYYDSYLGSYNNNSYTVTKRGLWQDGAHTGHEIFEYRFTPKNYKYTVMLSAGMNADETQGIWGLATFIRCLMNEEEPNMSIMKNNIRFIVIPIINASGFDQASLRYVYSNGVNPNWNFNYKDSWSRNTATLAQKGEYPDSNVETQGLKKWINEYSGIAQLYVDMHTGRFQQSDDPVATDTTILDIRFGNTYPYYSDFNSIHLPLIKQFYIDKGYITSESYIGAGASSVATSLDYQKHAYAVQVCGINSAMPEMHIESTGYGSDGLTNNTVEGIKGYVLQVRQIIMFVINKYISDKAQTLELVDLDILRSRNY